MFTPDDYTKVGNDPTASRAEIYTAMAAMRIADRLEVITSAAGLGTLLTELEPVLEDLEQKRRSVM